MPCKWPLQLFLLLSYLIFLRNIRQHAWCKQSHVLQCCTTISRALDPRPITAGHLRGLPFCIISDSSLTSLRRRLLPSWRRSLYRPCRILWGDTASSISGLAFSPLGWMAFEGKGPHVVVHVLGLELHYVCYLVLPLRDTAECRWFTWLVKLLLPIRHHCKNHCITI